jgi:hypothetical protein
VTVCHGCPVLHLQTPRKHQQTLIQKTFHLPPKFFHNRCHLSRREDISACVNHFFSLSCSRIRSSIPHSSIAITIDLSRLRSCSSNHMLRSIKKSPLPCPIFTILPILLHIIAPPTSIPQSPHFFISSTNPDLSSRCQFECWRSPLTNSYATLTAVFAMQGPHVLFHRASGATSESLFLVATSHQIWPSSKIVKKPHWSVVRQCLLC